MKANVIIKIDKEVLAELAKRAEGFETRNHVLRRILGLEAVLDLKPTEAVPPKFKKSRKEK